MDYGFSVQDIENINKLLNGNQEKQNENKTEYFGTGSVLRPDNIVCKKSEENKELAKPYFKIEAKYNNRNLTKPENDIWTDKDVKEVQDIIEDGRQQPEYDVFYKQTVGAEDLYLGLDGKDNSSNCCNEMSIKIKLPETSIKEISVEVKKQSIHLNVISIIIIINIFYFMKVESKICFKLHFTLSGK